MSWSLSLIGQPAAIRQAVSDSFDSAAASYRGKLEETEVLSTKERALAAIDEIIERGLRHLGPSTYAPKGLDLKVHAYGSHSDPDWGLGVSVHLTIEAIKIE